VRLPALQLRRRAVRITTRRRRPVVLAGWVSNCTVSHDMMETGVPMLRPAESCLSRRRRYGPTWHSSEPFGFDSCWGRFSTNERETPVMPPEVADYHEITLVGPRLQRSEAPGLQDLKTSGRCTKPYEHYLPGIPHDARRDPDGHSGKGYLA
jgi:hypothetical protein